jgi:PAS domain S-box-containing protein
LSDIAAVPLVVASPSRDPVEALNSLLRRNGIPAHCTWIPSLQDLPEALEQLNPELLFCVTQDGSELRTVVEVRDQVAAGVPLLVLRSETSEETIAADMALGARDSLSLGCVERIQSVVDRELKACRIERALRMTLLSAQDYRRQLETVLTRSNDAIVVVQEGIIIESNASWLELIGAPDSDGLTGQPIMDLFDEANHAALKGALVACQQGRWSDHALQASLLTRDGGSIGLELILSLGQRDEEPCIHLIVPAQKRDEQHIGRDLADAVRRNPRTGLLYRAPLLEALRARTASPPQGGARYVVCLRPDHYARLEQTLGVFHAEDFIVALAGTARAHLAPNDLLGHFSGPGLLALIERGTALDAELWIERLLEKIRHQPFVFGDRTVQVSLSAGMATVPNAGNKLEAVISSAIDAAQRARQRGGDQLGQVNSADTDARVQAYDAVWVKHINAALKENRFRLVQQPIASLDGSGGLPMFDMLLRMIDTQGKEVLPSEFIPAAERNDLLRNIDRWVLSAAARFARRKGGCLFVRLSRASALDATLLPWLGELLKSLQLGPEHLCIQVTESVASRDPDAVARLAAGVRKVGMRFALEHFGTGIDSLGLLERLPLDFVKIDGTLMQGLPEDEVQQERVRALVEAARERKISTIAERVEDANTMAVLWQLGVQHLQGYLIQAPEEVVIGAKG